MDKKGRSLISIQTISNLTVRWGSDSVDELVGCEKCRGLISELEYHITHDYLTGLYNRSFFDERLKEIDHSAYAPVTIITADVNGLRLANNAFGPECGDNLLKRFSNILRDVDDIEMAARLGGDDFVILMQYTESEQAEQFIDMVRTMCEAVRVNDLPLSVSFGHARRKPPGENIRETLKRAKNRMNRHKLSEVCSARGRIIHTIVQTLHDKNQREEQHSQRVSILSQALGEAMGLSELKQKELMTLGLLHDIGKIAIDEKILNKAGRLDADEYEEIRRHTEIGYRILSSVKEMAELADYVLAHHEHWDGRGYPRGLIGQEIPHMARIIGVVDAYDAMTSDRSYRNAMSDEEAIVELMKHSGTQFDPDIVRVFTESSDVRFRDTIAGFDVNGVS